MTCVDMPHVAAPFCGAPADAQAAHMRSARMCWPSCVEAPTVAFARGVAHDSVLTSVATIDTLADLLEQLGGLAPGRVRFRPAPGTAIEKDVLEVEAHEDRLCELVDGVLVEKAMGWRESLLASVLITLLSNFVRPRNLGLVTGEAGMVRLASGLVRIPDVAFVSGTAYPTGVYPATQSQLWHPILPWKC